MNKLNFESKGEARSYFKYMNAQRKQLEGLTFPKFRIVDDATPDEQLGNYSTELWNKVFPEIVQAMQDNIDAYEDCERKIYE